MHVLNSEKYASHSAEIKELEKALKKQTKHHEVCDLDNSSLSALMYKFPLFSSTFQIIDHLAKDLFYSHAQEIEGDLKKCSDQFKMFERQDLKYQEDLKHLKQKLKKVEEKILKVIFLLSSNMSTLQSSPRRLHPVGSLDPSKAKLVIQRMPYVTAMTMCRNFGGSLC